MESDACCLNENSIKCVRYGLVWTIIIAVQALVKDDLHRDVAGHVTRQPIRDVSTDQLPLMADDVQQPLLNGDLDGKADH